MNFNETCDDDENYFNLSVEKFYRFSILSEIISSMTSWWTIYYITRTQTKWLLASFPIAEKVKTFMSKYFCPQKH